MSAPNPDGNLGGEEHMTMEPAITKFERGNVQERLVIPEGEVTDYSSIPDSGILGWLAKKLGFDKNAPYFTRSGKIHDMLYWAIKYRNGFLPYGWYQFYNTKTLQWEPVIAYKWERQEADIIWEDVSIDDGCPVALAKKGYDFLRTFGGIHMFLFK